MFDPVNIPFGGLAIFPIDATDAGGTHKPASLTATVDRYDYAYLAMAQNPATLCIIPKKTDAAFSVTVTFTGLSQAGNPLPTQTQTFSFDAPPPPPQATQITEGTVIVGVNGPGAPGDPGVDHVQVNLTS